MKKARTPQMKKMTLTLFAILFTVAQCLWIQEAVAYQGGKDSTSKDRRIKYLQAKVKTLEDLLNRKDAKIKWLAQRSGAASVKTHISSKTQAGETKTLTNATTTAEKDTTPLKTRVLEPQEDVAPTILQIQNSLKISGYYDGPLTGYMGPLTHDAIRQFQSANSLVNDGFVGQETWKVLKVAADTTSSD